MVRRWRQYERPTIFIAPITNTSRPMFPKDVKCVCKNLSLFAKIPAQLIFVSRDYN